MVWGRQGNAWNPSGWPLLNSIWYGGVGSKERMKRHAKATRSLAQVSMSDPDSQVHGFICFVDWPTAIDSLNKLPQRYNFEMIAIGSFCKPHLDVDSYDPPESLKTVQLVKERANPLIILIFSEDYDIELQESDLIWLPSLNQKKLSTHLVISTHSPQYLYETNLKSSSNGASHLAYRLEEMDPELGSIIDKSIYTTDREMRMMGSAKPDKPNSILLPDAPCDPLETVITHIEADCQIIKVPMVIPRFKTSPAPKGVRKKKMTVALPADNFVIDRMITLFKPLHATIFHEPSHGQEDAFDSSLGVKLNFRDRSEPCFNGSIHSGTQNLKAWISDSGDVLAKCFSDKCNAATHTLGRLREDSTEWRDNAVTVNMQFFNRDRSIIQTHLSRDDMADSNIVFNVIVNNWLLGKPKGLGLRGPLGGGKTDLMEKVLQEPCFAGQTVLMISYRQSLAYNLAERLGFTNYLECDNLSDRSKYPWIVCQLDSIGDLAKMDRLVPLFDNIFMDEIMSLLNHLSATTLKSESYIMKKLEKMLTSCRCKRVLTADGLWEQEAYDFLKAVGIDHQLVINEYKAPQRTFVFTDDYVAWKKQIIEDVKAGYNVAVVSMATEVVYDVAEELRELLPEEEIIIHTSKADDELKKKLRIANDFWVTRAVMISPTVEAGVDKSDRHFHKMHVCACMQSTTAMGLYQMTGRFRQLEDLTINCCARPGIRLTPPFAPKVTFQECLDHLMYVDQTVTVQADKEVVRTSSGDEIIVPKISPLLIVWAHNEARRQNSNNRFFPEFKEIVESQGHKVVITPSQKFSKPSKSMTFKAADLLAARDLTDFEFHDIHIKRCTNNATQEDKAAHDKHWYKILWGLDVVTSRFIQANGTNPGCPEVSLIMQLLFQEPMLRDEETPRQQQAILRIRFINEVLSALNWRSPFDVGVYRTVEDIRTALLATRMWANYARNIKVFSTKAETAKNWDEAKSIAESLNTILGAIGISVHSKITKPRIDGKQIRLYRYCIDRTSAEKVASLVNLKTRLQIQSDNPQAEAFLQSVSFAGNEDVVREEDRQPLPDFLTDSDDEGV